MAFRSIVTRFHKVSSSSSSLRIKPVLSFLQKRPPCISPLQIRSFGSSETPSPLLRLRVASNFNDLVKNSRAGAGAGDKRHWLVILKTHGFEFATEKALFDFYINVLTTAVGSEEEAIKKIYLVSCEWYFGFGAEFDEAVKYKLEVHPCVTDVLEDDQSDAARKNNSGEQSISRFTPLNWNCRLDDIYRYHYLSNRNLEWSFNHWLVHIKKPDGKFNAEQTVDFCMRLLADVVGSVESAKEKIYIVWCKIPFGFGAEIDEETINKLKDMPSVLTVLADYAFDVKKKDRGVLVIPPSYELQPDYRIFYFDLKGLTDEPDRHPQDAVCYYSDPEDDYRKWVYRKEVVKKPMYDSDTFIHYLKL